MALNFRQSGHWLAAHRKLKGLGHLDPENFALAKPAKGAKARPDYDTIERIFFEILAQVRSQLAKQHVHVGYTVLELAVFEALLEGGTDPVEDIVQLVLSRGLHNPGFLIYPLFGFGLLHARDESLLKRSSSLEIIDDTSGVAVTSCLDDRASFLAFLNRAIEGLGVVGRLPDSSLDHHLAMKGLNDWLLRNPLLLVRIRSISMGARENQRRHLKSIAHRATLLGLISALAAPRTGSRLSAGSTQSTSNRETLDIRHYFVFESRGTPDQELRSERVSLGPVRAPMLQYADLDIDVDPAAWRTSTLQSRLRALTDALLDLEDLQAAVDGGSGPSLKKKNTSQKLSTSLHWARRSFASFADPREAVVAMAVAFEALLSDGYSKGITATIIARANICLKTQRGSPTLIQAVSTLFEWRGSIVHKGQGPSGINLRYSRRAFALCFIEVMKRVVAATPTATLVTADLFDI